MKIALASPPLLSASSLQDGLAALDLYTKMAAAAGASIVCFPESFLPGYPGSMGMGYAPENRSPEALADSLAKACIVASQNNTAIILPMDYFMDGVVMNLAFVISNLGDILGHQTKNQLDPSEDLYWVAGTKRQVFKIGELTFGIVICHEGFRYPESVRWCAIHGAQLVFHPHFNGSNTEGTRCTSFMAVQNPYYEKAMMMRALENGVYFASVNYASTYQESASAVFAPDGTCLTYQRYGKPGIITMDIDPNLASRIYAKRFKPDLYKYP